MLLTRMHSAATAEVTDVPQLSILAGYSCRNSSVPFAQLPFPLERLAEARGTRKPEAPSYTRIVRNPDPRAADDVSGIAAADQ